MNRRAWIGAFVTAAALAAAAAAHATSVAVCAAPDRNARFAVAKGEAPQFRAAVRAFAAEAGYEVVGDEEPGGFALFDRAMTSGLSVTIAEPEAYVGFIDDTPCDKPLVGAGRATWGRFLRFMAARGFRGRPYQGL